MGHAPVIRVENLGKRFQIGETGPGLFAEHIATRLRGRLSRPQQRESFWALRGLTFEIGESEVVGVIGRNGAGKSTLLKMLAGITKPTEGRIGVRGRVGTLLEVGTGFQPDLTGRENVYLSGTILGMKRKEIHDRFDGIVEFAGVERFIDTPVKWYSSGMKVRLGFAVASHLTPEILLVDEVLAVGDADFQRRCMAKMKNVVQEGRTVVFVSHSMTNVKDLCDRAYWIENGEVASEGATDDVVTDYLKKVEVQQEGGVAMIDPRVARVGNRAALVNRVELLDADGDITAALRLCEPFSIRFQLDVTRPVSDALFEIGICDGTGTRIVTATNADEGGTARLAAGPAEVTVGLDTQLLPGEYLIDVAVHHDDSRSPIDHVERVLRFGVEHDPYAGRSGSRVSPVRGHVRPVSRWAVSP